MSEALQGGVALLSQTWKNLDHNTQLTISVANLLLILTNVWLLCRARGSDSSEPKQTEQTTPSKEPPPKEDDGYQTPAKGVTKQKSRHRHTLSSFEANANAMQLQTPVDSPETIEEERKSESEDEDAVGEMSGFPTVIAKRRTLSTTDEILGLTSSRRKSQTVEAVRIFDTNDVSHKIPPFPNKELDQLMETFSGERMGDWDFDIRDMIKPCEAAGVPPVVVVANSCFNSLGFFDKFNIDREKMYRLSFHIHFGMKDNPYHCSLHAADVTANAYCLFTSEELQSYCQDIDILAAIVAAMAHDYGHPGTNQDYHIKTQSQYAITYNNKSVLENYHACKLMSFLRTEGTNIATKLHEDPEEHQKLWVRLRDTIITLILGTDMTFHKKHQDDLQSVFERHHIRHVRCPLTTPRHSARPSPKDDGRGKRRRHTFDFGGSADKHKYDESNMQDDDFESYNPSAEKRLREHFQRYSKDMEDGVPSLTMTMDEFRLSLSELRIPEESIDRITNEFTTQYKVEPDTNSFSLKSFIEWYTEHIEKKGPVSVTDREVVMVSVFHAADIGNPCSVWDSTQDWALRINKEWWHQFRCEEEAGLKTTAMMDPSKADIPRGQLGFIDYVCMPYYKLLSKLLPSTFNPLVSNLSNNRQRWQDKLNTKKAATKRKKGEEKWKKLSKHGIPLLHVKAAFKSTLSSSIEEILGVLKDTPVFCKASEEQLQTLAKKLEPALYKTGEEVITQGQKGEDFFIIQKGTCDVVLEKECGNKVRVAQLGPGEYIGEQALLYEAPRTATVVARSTLHTLKMSRPVFQQCCKDLNLSVEHFRVVYHGQYIEELNSYEVKYGSGKNTRWMSCQLIEDKGDAVRIKHDGKDMTCPRSHIRKKMDWLLACVNDNALFKQLNEKQRIAVAEKFVKRTYPTNTELSRQGTNGFTFYIVENGKFDVRIDGHIGDSKAPTSSVTANEYFGDKSLVEDSVSPATITAAMESVVWQIDRAAYNMAIVET